MLLQDADVMPKVKEVNARVQDITWQINALGLKESSSGKSRNVGQRFLTTPLLILGAVRGGSRDRGPIIFRPSIKKADLAFLEKEDCFASLEKIGSGTGTKVYKAELPESNGKMIAITKVNRPLPKSEIIIVGKIRHRNILPLLAHIVRPDCDLIVYEFMKNGSLRDILYDVSLGRRELDWLSRYRIALGVATGLEYLHMYRSACVIHGDIKPAKVLLNDDMEAYICDVGTAIVIPGGHTHITTSILVGTIGYIAPEYYQGLELTTKCDIYSFGVLLAVLVMGKLPSNDFFRHTEEMNFVKWIRNVMSSENPNRAIDPRLLGNVYEYQMLLVFKLAFFCTLDNPKERPNSKDARSMLSQVQRY